MFGFSFKSKSDDRNDERIRVKTIVHKELVVEGPRIRLTSKDEYTTLCIKDGWRYLTMNKESIEELRGLLNAQVKAENEDED